MTFVEMLYGIGAILAALGGITLIVREWHRRERKASDQQLDTLSRQLNLCRVDAVSIREYAYLLAVALADAGVDVPAAPKPTAQADEEKKP